jgi:hypothetical protein
MPALRFPPRSSVEEFDAGFVVRDHAIQFLLITANISKKAVIETALMLSPQ